MIDKQHKVVLIFQNKQPNRPDLISLLEKETIKAAFRKN